VYASIRFLEILFCEVLSGNDWIYGYVYCEWILVALYLAILGQPNQNFFLKRIETVGQ